MKLMPWVLVALLVPVAAIADESKAKHSVAEKPQRKPAKKKANNAAARRKAKQATYKTRNGRRLKRLNRGTVRMDDARLDAEIKALDKKATGTLGRWSLKVDGVDLMVISDTRADRMRIIAPIVSAKKLDKAILTLLLEANFDRALDAKYTIWQGTVWAAYAHPLSPLTKEQFVSAARQVASLRNTFGTSFSSMDIVFGSP